MRDPAKRIYGVSALRAVELIRESGNGSDPDAAWLQATSEATVSPANHTRGGPRATFLGLCEAGLIPGVPVGNYLKDVKNALNKDFALAALVALAQTPELARRPLTLWKVATGGVHTRYAYQMDVVLALWNAGITKTTPAATASAAS